MKKNKLILFDWGNIVEDGTACKQAWFDLFAEAGYDADDTRTRLRTYELSAIKTIEEFKETYKEMKKDFNLKVDFEEFKQIYLKHYANIKYYPEVAEYEHSLGDKCYIGILSNLCIFDKERIDKQLGLANYDYTFLSFEIGAKKPNKEIFEYVMDNVPFAPEDILFIDDKDGNINMAKEMGWNTLKATHEDFDLIKEECESFIDNDNKKYYVYEMNINILNVMSMVLFAFMLILTYVLNGDMRFEYQELALMLMLMIPYLILHELIHALAYIINGASPKRITFGAHLEKSVLCCLCKQNVKKRNILISLVSPFILIGVVTYILGIVLNNTMLTYLSIMNISGCSGDLMMFLAFLKLKDFEYAEYDNPISFGLYSKKDLSKEKMLGLKYIETKNKLKQDDLKKISISKVSMIYFICIIIGSLLLLFL